MTPPTGARSEGESERFIILQMVQDGTITPDDGARLLEAMDRAERKVPAPPPPPPPPKEREIRVRITGVNGSKDVDFTLPLVLVEMGLNLANTFAPGKLPDLTEVRRAIHEGFTGTLLDTDHGSNHIQIIIQER